jgi:hypothetical protein
VKPRLEIEEERMLFLQTLVVVALVDVDGMAWHLT